MKFMHIILLGCSMFVSGYSVAYYPEHVPAEKCHKIGKIEGMFWCLSCDSVEPSTDVKGCSLCPNRIVKDNFCILKNCPNDRPLRDKEGKCWPCGWLNETENKAVYEEIIYNPVNCNICSNRRQLRLKNSDKEILEACVDLESGKECPSYYEYDYQQKLCRYCHPHYGCEDT